MSMIKRINRKVYQDIKRIIYDDGFFSETCITTLLTADLRKIMGRRIDECTIPKESVHGADILITVSGLATFSFQAKKISLNKSRTTKTIDLSLKEDLDKDRINKVFSKYYSDIRTLPQEIKAVRDTFEKIVNSKKFSQYHLQFISYLVEQRLRKKRYVPFYLFYVSNEVIKECNLRVSSGTLLLANSLKMIRLNSNKTAFEVEDFKAKNHRLLRLLKTIPDNCLSEAKKRSVLKDVEYKNLIKQILDEKGSWGFFQDNNLNSFKDAVTDNDNLIEECTQIVLENLLIHKNVTSKRKMTLAPHLRIRTIWKISKTIRRRNQEFLNFLDKSDRNDEIKILHFELLNLTTGSRLTSYFNPDKISHIENLFFDYVESIINFKKFEHPQRDNYFLNHYIEDLSDIKEDFFYQTTSVQSYINPEYEDIQKFIIEIKDDVLKMELMPFTGEEKYSFEKHGFFF